MRSEVLPFQLLFLDEVAKVLRFLLLFLDEHLEINKNTCKSYPNCLATTDQ